MAEAIVPSKVTQVIIPLEATEATVLPKATEIIRHGHLLGMRSKSPVDTRVSFEGSYVQKEIGAFIYFSS